MAKQLKRRKILSFASRTHLEARIGLACADSAYRIQSFILSASGQANFFTPDPMSLRTVKPEHPSDDARGWRWHSGVTLSSLSSRPPYPLLKTEHLIQRLCRQDPLSPLIQLRLTSSKAIPIIGIYLWLGEVHMSTHAKLFMSGRSQAVRLPKELRFEGDIVIAKRFGNGVLLLPEKDPWQIMQEALEEFEPDFLASLEREQPESQQQREAW